MSEVENFYKKCTFTQKLTNHNFQMAFLFFSTVMESNAQDYEIS